MLFMYVTMYAWVYRQRYVVKLVISNIYFIMSLYVTIEYDLLQNIDNWHYLHALIIQTEHQTTRKHNV